MKIFIVIGTVDFEGGVKIFGCFTDEKKAESCQKDAENDRDCIYDNVYIEEQELIQ
jgi:hypothetical protein